MVDEIYYLGFDRIEAMQWVDGSNGDTIARFLGRNHGDWTRDNGKFLCYGIILEPGQWVMKLSNGDTAVHGDKPAYLERWIWGSKTPMDTEPEECENEEEARHPGKKWLMGQPYTVHRKPVVRTGPNPGSMWTGPWELVN